MDLPLFRSGTPQYPGARLRRVEPQHNPPRRRGSREARTWVAPLHHHGRRPAGCGPAPVTGSRRGLRRHGRPPRAPAQLRPVPAETPGSRVVPPSERGSAVRARQRAAFPDRDGFTAGQPEGPGHLGLGQPGFLTRVAQRGGIDGRGHVPGIVSAACPSSVPARRPRLRGAPNSNTFRVAVLIGPPHPAQAIEVCCPRRATLRPLRRRHSDLGPKPLGTKSGAAPPGREGRDGRAWKEAVLRKAFYRGPRGSTLVHARLCDVPAAGSAYQMRTAGPGTNRSGLRNLSENRL